ncbi:hypothetical protein DF051_31530 [Burkholderia contaminans]|uniref:Uncharacterized protein n=1 Tax=Burkholderia contaminans TaxID=488447 RepID=A0A3N8P928_9BURK|nr:hypothetical protein DF051_31530 [Burkholderia contaminans]
MPGAAQCESPPRRRFRDMGPIINQRDADRQPPAPCTVGGITGRGGVSARSAPRFCNDGRSVAILPAHARVGLLTDCKESSDERRAADLSCRQRGIGAEKADCRSNAGE